MNRRWNHGARPPIDDSNLSAGARQLVKALLGDDLPIRNRTVEVDRDQLDLLRWVATFSPKHEKQLRRLELAETESRESAELLAWVASISSVQEAGWDPAKHPRRGGAPNAGWFASAGGTSAPDSVRTAGLRNTSSAQPVTLQTVGYPRSKNVGKAKSPSSVAKPTGSAGRPEPQPTQSATQSTTQKINAGNIPGDPSRWYLPSDEKGTWTGDRGNSTFRLTTPVEVNGKLVHEVKFTRGLPVLDEFALPENTIAVVLTGDSQTDIRNATATWKKLHPDDPFPKGTTFHHDLLQVTEETVEINGKKTKILVGKMQLVPEKINRLVFHEGSASVADKFYKGLNIDVASIKELARQQAALAKDADRLVAKAARKIKPGKIAQGVLPLVGRSVVRAIPIIGTGLAIIEFSDNVEAHGVGGAVVRAVPVLGDLIAARDLGSDLAKQITDAANSKLADAYQDANNPVAKSWKAASDDTIRAFNELAPQIVVTNQPGSNGRVDVNEIGDALNEYRREMQIAYNLKETRGTAYNFAAAATAAKQKLKTKLTEACQKNKPKPSGPIL